MHAVLGIDAAWTPRNASGVCLVVQGDGGWRCERLAASYSDFVAGAVGAEVGDVLESTRALLGGKLPEVVAVDMPLARSPITGRRAADDAVSKKFARNWCSTHSPNPDRPGVVAEELRASVESCGYRLVTRQVAPASGRSLIEVYPHPAILRLLHLDLRLPYKVSNERRYWPDKAKAERRAMLLDQMRRLEAGVAARIAGLPPVMDGLTASTPLRLLKRAEDALDAVVCAWVGICFLEGCAEPFGDDSAAIWVPVAEVDQGRQSAASDKYPSIQRET